MPEICLHVIALIMNIKRYANSAGTDRKVTVRKLTEVFCIFESGYTPALITTQHNKEQEMENPYATPSSDPSLPDSGQIDKSNPFSPSGRFGRLSFIAWYMLVTIVGYVIMFAVGGATLITATDPNVMMEFLSSAGGIIYILITVISLIIFILFVIRRLHDVNKTGWMALLMILPLINLFFLIYLLVAKGDTGSNRFAGFRPTPTWERILGYIGIGFFIIGLIGILAAIIIPVVAQL
jgi:uncharacterized membrane protein YhaH (DUF805 family)